MPDIDQAFLRKLADWNVNGVPVTSMYLDVDGRRYPRKHLYVSRAEHLCNQLRREAEALGKKPASSVAKDTQRMMEFVEGLDRGRTRGLALFSKSVAGLWEEALVPSPLRDRAVVGQEPYVLPLEAVVEKYESFCTVLVDRSRARIFLARMGRISEHTDVFDDVPGQHEQGGWSRSRYQRHIEDHAARHLRHVGEVLLRFFKLRKFDHLILAGPEELIPEFEHGLHDYLKRRAIARLNLSVTASAADVLERSMAVEEKIEAERERQTVERLLAEASAERQAVIGLGPTLVALYEDRVETLVAPVGLSAEGFRCTRCGWLDPGGSVREGDQCATCGGDLERVPDIVETAVATALRQGSRVEALPVTAANNGPLLREVGALLRF